MRLIACVKRDVCAVDPTPLVHLRCAILIDPWHAFPTGSIAIITEAVHSSIDLLASIVAFPATIATDAAARSRCCAAADGTRRTATLAPYAAR